MLILGKHQPTGRFLWAFRRVPFLGFFGSVCRLLDRPFCFVRWATLLVFALDLFLCSFGLVACLFVLFLSAFLT